MAKYDIYSNGATFPMLTTQNYVKNADGTISTIADLNTLAPTEIGFIGHPTAIHKILLADRNISVLDDKKSDKTHLHTGVYEPLDNSILKAADIGVAVQGYDATLLKSADIGITVETFDSSILKVADIGVVVELFDPTIIRAADIGITVQGYNLNTVVDASYVHTDSNYTVAEKTKLGNLFEGYLGYFLDYIALTSVHITGTAGQYATLGSTNTMWMWDTGTAAWVDTASTSANLNTSILTASGNIVAGGKYMTVLVAAATLTLPLNPAAGDTIKISDGDANWSINPVTINNNAKTIENILGTLVLNVSGSSKELIYSGTTWRVF